MGLPIHSGATCYNLNPGPKTLKRKTLNSETESPLCLLQALHAFELALSLEKLNFQKMWHLDHVATKADDYEMASFVEDMMHKQVTAFCKGRDVRGRPRV